MIKTGDLQSRIELLEQKSQELEEQLKKSVRIEGDLIRTRNVLKQSLEQARSVYEFMINSTVDQSFGAICQNFLHLLLSNASIQRGIVFQHQSKSAQFTPVHTVDADAHATASFKNPNGFFGAMPAFSKVQLISGKDEKDIFIDFFENLRAYFAEEGWTLRGSFDMLPILVFCFGHLPGGDSLVAIVIGEDPTLTSAFDPRISSSGIEFYQLVASAFQRAIHHKATYEDLRKLAYHLQGKLDESQVGLSDAIEQLRATQKALVYNEKMAVLGEMAAGIAHEINNPLTVIIAMNSRLRLLLESPELTSERKKINEITDKVENTSFRIAKIVKGLRAFARNDEMQAPQPESMHGVILETLDLCIDKYKSSDVQLIYEPPKQDAVVSVRKVQISQVLLNLLVNAHDAVEGVPNAWVRIHFEKEGNRMNLFITDSGPGIPKSIVEKLFQPFFTTKEIGKGTGLGLSISKGIVEQHGGSIRINESSPNTQFVVSLPLG